MAAKPGERKLQILQTIATMLEQPKGEKITTALLASRLDISEAALYRHFASKAQMFAASAARSPLPCLPLLPLPSPPVAPATAAVPWGDVPWPPR
jgi:AcrR family transcriptional regulator